MAGPKRALVTGGAGCVGSNLVVELLRRSWQVRALDDFSAGKHEHLKGISSDRFELREGRHSESSGMRAGLSGHGIRFPPRPRFAPYPVRSMTLRRPTRSTFVARSTCCRLPRKPACDALFMPLPPRFMGTRVSVAPGRNSAPPACFSLCRFEARRRELLPVLREDDEA